MSLIGHLPDPVTRGQRSSKMCALFNITLLSINRHISIYLKVQPLFLKYLFLEFGLIMKFIEHKESSDLIMSMVTKSEKY